ncbi:hypothetical protein JCM10212_000742 [Sporobolomyces blumeae]
MAEALASSFESLDVSASDTSLDLALVLSQLESLGSEQATEVADELTSLAAIYDNPEPCLSIYRPPATSRSPSPPASWDPSTAAPLRLVLATTLAPPLDDTPFHLLLSIPVPVYPASEPPLIQLQDRYLSNFAVDDNLFAEVLRTFMHDADAGLASGVEWTGGVCLFEGIEHVKEVCSRWVQERAAEKQRGEELRNAAARDHSERTDEGGEQERHRKGELAPEDDGERIQDGDPTSPRLRRPPSSQVKCPEIVSAEPLVDRKSVFVGHVARVQSVEQVDAVMSELLSNNRVARATHNISAYQFVSGDGIRHSDNDDDGETAAGSRLAHLLELLDVQNVLVVVTRWYGGVHLGPDRFKDINQAARDALIAGGFLVEQEKVKGKGGKSGTNAKKK